MRIFLDMDGVLSNFEGYYASLYGADSYTILENNISKYKAMEYSQNTAIQLAENEFISHIKADPSFWLNIKPYSWAKNLYEFCQSMAPTFLLTAVMMEDLDRTIPQKIEFAKTHISDTASIIFTPSARDSATGKHMGMKDVWMHTPKDILIDDSLSNILSWKGVGILFRPNIRRSTAAVNAMDRQINNIKSVITTTLSTY